jgi:hypothetical protein
LHEYYQANCVIMCVGSICTYVYDVHIYLFYLYIVQMSPFDLHLMLSCWQMQHIISYRSPGGIIIPKTIILIVAQQVFYIKKINLCQQYSKDGLEMRCSFLPFWFTCPYSLWNGNSIQWKLNRGTHQTYTNYWKTMMKI